MLRNRIDRNKNQNIILRCKKGFTLIEAVVVLVILAVVAAIAIPTASHYIKLAQFRKNEANAKTAYLAAESVLTWYRTSGEWESFREEIIEKGTLNETFEADSAVAREGRRIYAVTLNGRNASEASGSQDQVMTLLKDCSYDGDFFNGAIAVEVDVDTGLVYSAFYATRCQELSYEGTDTDGVLNISATEGNRAYDNRKGRLLGYYSTEDVANVVDLNPIQLKVTSINLVNSETLSLNWSSNSRHDNRDVDFNITFYNNDGRTPLFSTQINRSRLIESGWDGSVENQMVSLPLKADGTDLGTWNFPMLYLEGSSGRNGRFSLILDGMMSASLMESLKANPSEDYARSSSTSITRLGNLIPGLENPQDIYAVIEAEPDYTHMEGDMREYNKSLPVTSNVENTLFAKAKTSGAESSEELEAEISRFRHLSNIRYYNTENKAEFKFTGRSIDWTAAGAGLYDSVANNEGIRKLKWQSSLQGEKVLDFPSVPLLSSKHTLTGKGSGLIPFLTFDVSLVNVHLGKESVPKDTDIEKLYSGAEESHYSRYIGLFSEVEGTIENVNLQNPVLELTGEQKEDAVEDLAYLYGAGILCGRSQGKLTDVSVKVTDKNAQTVTVRLKDRENPEAGNQRDKNPAGIGGLVGVIAQKDGDGKLVMLTSGSTLGLGDGEALIKGLSMEGNIEAELPDPIKAGNGKLPEEEAESYSYGIGGIFGYAWIGGTVKAADFENHANVTGNLFTGGVGGRVTGDYENKDNTSDYTHSSGLADCASDGLILCAQNASRKDEDAELTGRYFGGILGYGSKVEIAGSASASGRSSSYRYMKNGFDESEKESTLLGQYVGGVIGYGNGCHLKGCGTERGGYILGSDYVGGIAGGLSNDIQQVITGNGGTGSAALTVNESYVIGNSYVGGIVGKNDGDARTVVHNCVNNGVVAGYGYCIGGIVGYNGKKGVLEDCSSYLSDYDHSIYNTIIQNWQAGGNCVGGLAGYNNGEINFSESSSAAAVKSVSSVVTGKNFVGGIIGFNDIDGKMDADYELIGGQIYASGIGAGGAVGLNASVQLLDDEFAVRPVSVTGEYCVGGIIGANVVDLKENIKIESFKANNGIGSINGTAFTGGIIGYQRTYTEDQIASNDLPADQSCPEGSELLKYLLAETGEAFNGEALLPKLDENSLPTKVMESDNTNILTITNRANSRDSLDDANNNIPIRGYAYIGGIVGYCERGSRLVLLNCKNSAEISRLGSADNREGVSLKAYLAHEGMSQAADQIEDATRVYMIGGIIGANMENQVIDHCVNTGNMRGFRGLGGIVGFNAGGVFNCELANNFGNAELDYIGGIAGLNVNAGAGTYDYTDVKGINWNAYTSGTIGACTTRENRNISGRSYVGGIAGFNLLGGTLTDNTSNASVNAAGNYAGGIAGGNAGEIWAAEDNGNISRTVTGTNGQGIGGLVGCNKQTGTISVKADGSKDEVTAVGSGVSITGNEKAGGIAGINEGTLRAESSQGGTVYLTAQAREVRALNGYAGGIAGEAGGAGGNITQARNRCARVTANKGLAGGIVAANGAGMLLADCENLGNVNSDAGYAGGIAAENLGTIRNCQVGDGKQSVTINSNGVEEIGAVCAINRNEIIIAGKSPVQNSVKLSGNAGKAGGVAGVNEGKILGEGTAKITSMPELSLSKGGLTVGGAAGENRENGSIQGITADGLSFEGFRNYRYLGGIVGENLSVLSKNKDGQPVAGVMNCRFINGVIREGSSAVRNCYGGIAGSNSGILTDCEVSGLNINVTGVYTATSTSTAKEKEESAVHVGGVAGKNEENAEIIGCLISADAKSTITVANGMAGGIAGYNKGSISLSGDAGVETWMDGVDKPGSEGELNTAAAKLRENVSTLPADENYVNWNGGNNVQLEDFTYNKTGEKVSAYRDLLLCITTNGNVGGITAYNAPTGELDRCATGNWYLNNKSNAIGVGTGGIIGMNESEKDLSLLLNRAFVGRQLRSGATDRFAGGIIGNQNNTTTSGWKIQGCINYGTVYCLNTHYSGGILGQWTGTGGTIRKCYNYGNLQTTYKQGWKGASAGIVAQLYHAYENNDYNIISCGNYGNIFGQDGRMLGGCANDSAGILGNVTAYRVDEGNSDDFGQTYTIQVLDCVNGSGVEIYSGSMASGIVGFFSCDDPGTASPADYNNVERSTGNIILRIERCRNFASILKGSPFAGGILGERYGAKGTENTFLKDCYSVNRSTEFYNNTYGGRNYPMISYANPTNYTNSVSYFDKEKYGNVENNYYLSEGVNNNDNVTDVTNGFILLNNLNVTRIGDGLRRAETRRAYLLPVNVDMGDNAGMRTKWFVSFMEENKAVNLTSLTLTDDVIYNGDTQVGKLLFSVPDGYGNKETTVAENIVKSGSDFDDYVRPAYHKLEDITNSVADGTYAKKMLQPKGAQLTIKGSRVEITVNPADGTDPFKYKAEVWLGDTVLRNLEFYSEEYSFELSEQEAALVDSNDLKITISACSMYDDVADSGTVDGTGTIVEFLPTPRIRIELVRDENDVMKQTYRFWLDNIEDYDKFKSENGTVPTWKIQMQGGNGKSVEITPEWNAGKWEKLYVDSSDLASASLQQLLVQAVGTGADADQFASEQVSVPVYLPKYTPSMSLTAGGAVPSVDVLGDNLANLSITVTLRGNAGNVTTPPVYRAELIGTWNAGKSDGIKDVVIASTDILASANGDASAVFNNLPEYMSYLDENRLPYVTDLKVRIWYAQSGLGPVYTYYSIKEGEDLYPLTGSKGNISLLDKVEKITEDDGAGNVTETVKPTFKAMDSPVLDSGNNFGNYRTVLPPSATDSLFSWIPAPNLAEEAELDLNTGAEQNRMQYTFKWDQGNGEYTAGASYIVSLTGINESGGEVSIVTNQTVNENQLQIDAEDWSYESVKLTVTRVGDESKKQIGLTASKVYAVKQRLPRPAQPTITNPNTNELNYTIEWVPVVPETGCGSYEIYVQPYKDDGTLGDPPIDPVKTVTVDSKNEGGIYSTDLPLEAYAGKKILVYLVAQPEADNSSYVRSVDGVTYELEVPSRISDPKIKWSKTWDYKPDDPVTVEDFQAEDETSGGGLNVTVVPAAAPPGDSSYLLKAYVFDSQEHAAAAADTLKSDNNEGLEDLVEGYLAVYPIQTESILSPASMTPMNSLEYQHTLRGLSAKYAGRWILFYARVSSGNGQISSNWVANEEVWQLPYVRLQEPGLASTSREMAMDATNLLNPDLPKQESWNAVYKAVEWNSVELADTYYMTLTPKSGSASSLQEQKFRIQEIETDDGNGGKVKEVKVSVAADDGSWTEITNKTVENNVYTFDLSDSYSMEVEESYDRSGAAPVNYKVTAGTTLEAVWEEATGFHYTLILPDADSVTAEDGTVINEVSLRPTGAVTVYADVKENASDKSAVNSQAYVWSDDSRLEFVN